MDISNVLSYLLHIHMMPQHHFSSRIEFGSRAYLISPLHRVFLCSLSVRCEAIMAQFPLRVHLHFIWFNLITEAQICG